MRYTDAEHDAFAADFNRDSLVVLRNHFDPDLLRRWRREFQPLLERNIAQTKDDPIRGAERFT